MPWSKIWTTITTTDRQCYGSDWKGYLREVEQMVRSRLGGITVLSDLVMQYVDATSQTAVLEVKMAGNPQPVVWLCHGSTTLGEVVTTITGRDPRFASCLLTESFFRDLHAPISLRPFDLNDLVPTTPADTWSMVKYAIVAFQFSLPWPRFAHNSISPGTVDWVWPPPLGCALGLPNDPPFDGRLANLLGLSFPVTYISDRIRNVFIDSRQPIIPGLDRAILWWNWKELGSAVWATIYAPTGAPFAFLFKALTAAGLQALFNLCQQPGQPRMLIFDMETALVDTSYQRFML